MSGYRVTIWDGDLGAVGKQCDTAEEAAQILFDAQELGLTGWIDSDEPPVYPTWIRHDVA